jgi:hypothetical protein
VSTRTGPEGRRGASRRDPEGEKQKKKETFPPSATFGVPAATFGVPAATFGVPAATFGVPAREIAPRRVRWRLSERVSADRGAA